MSCHSLSTGRKTLQMLLLTILLLGHPTSSTLIDTHQPLTIIPLKQSSLFGLDIPLSFNDFSAQTNGCKIYDLNNNCLFCIRDQFIQNTVCINIPYNQTINNCNINLNLTNCYQCDAGHAVSASGTSCVNIGTLNNCLTYFAISTCATCVIGSFFSSGQCSVPLPNCIVAASATTCQTCQVNYYLTATSTCLLVTNLIKNCLTYSATQLCTICSTGFALSTDGLSCLAGLPLSGQIDPNCQNSIVSTGSYCNLCTQGYYLTGTSTCATLNVSNVSCFIANPINPSLCLVCMKGYTIQTGNLCVTNTQTSQAQVGTNPVATTWAGLLRGIFSLVLLGLLIN